MILAAAPVAAAVAMAVARSIPFRSNGRVGADRPTRLVYHPAALIKH